MNRDLLNAQIGAIKDKVADAIMDSVASVRNLGVSSMYKTVRLWNAFKNI